MISNGKGTCSWLGVVISTTKGDLFVHLKSTSTVNILLGSFIYSLKTISQSMSMLINKINCRIKYLLGFVNVGEIKLLFYIRYYAIHLKHSLYSRALINGMLFEGSMIRTGFQWFLPFSEHNKNQSIVLFLSFLLIFIWEAPVNLNLREYVFRCINNLWHSLWLSRL